MTSSVNSALPNTTSRVDSGETSMVLGTNSGVGAGASSPTGSSGCSKGDSCPAKALWKVPCTITASG